MAKNEKKNGYISARASQKISKFNRKLTKADYVVPGGYEMVFGGRIISFDFMDYQSRTALPDCRAAVCRRACLWQIEL